MQVQLNDESLPILHALNSQTRLNILNCLARREMNITSLANKLRNCQIFCVNSSFSQIDFLIIYSK